MSVSPNPPVHRKINYFMWGLRFLLLSLLFSSWASLIITAVIFIIERMKGGLAVQLLKAKLLCLHWIYSQSNERQPAIIAGLLHTQLMYPLKKSCSWIWNLLPISISKRKKDWKLQKFHSCLRLLTYSCAVHCKTLHSQVLLFTYLSVRNHKQNVGMSLF